MRWLLVTASIFLLTNCAVKPHEFSDTDINKKSLHTIIQDMNALTASCKNKLDTDGAVHSTLQTCQKMENYIMSINNEVGQRSLSGTDIDKVSASAKRTDQVHKRFRDINWAKVPIN